MLKSLLLIGAAAMSLPAIAQTTPPVSDDPMAPPAQTESAPIAEDPVTPAPETSETAPPADESTATQPAPAANAAQIAQIVEMEFPTYDADSSAELNETEFAAWMTKLRTSTDPTVDPASEEVKTWIGQAFAAADVDKSMGVSKVELTGFLSRSA